MLRAKRDELEKRFNELTESYGTLDTTDVVVPPALRALYQHRGSSTFGDHPMTRAISTLTDAIHGVEDTAANIGRWRHAEVVPGYLQAVNAIDDLERNHASMREQLLQIRANVLAVSLLKSRTANLVLAVSKYTYLQESLLTY